MSTILVPVEMMGSFSDDSDYIILMYF